jgi:hypothetical protein
VLIENARLVSLAAAVKLIAPLLAPRLAARRLDIALLKDLLLPGGDAAGEVLLLPAGAVISGDLVLDWPHAAYEGRPYRGVVSEGDLTVTGDILNETGDAGAFLVALGALRVRRILQSTMTLVATGPITASDRICCELSHGSLRAYGGLRARELVIGDERLDVAGSPDALKLVLMDVEASELLLPDLFYERCSAAASSTGDLGRALGGRFKASEPAVLPPDTRRRVG